MSTCCQRAYDKEFDRSKAEKELRQYQANGLKKSSRPLRDILEGLPLQGSSLLDIGGGVGALTFELIKRGVSRSVYVDISSPYVQTFREEVERRLLETQVNSLQGDFLQVHPQIAPVDLVTLDKVICCYENYEDLIRYSSAKAKHWYAFTLPRHRWWVRWGQGIYQAANRLLGRSFTTYVHPTARIEEILQQAGFQKRRQSVRFFWTTMLFEKIS